MHLSLYLREDLIAAVAALAGALLASLFTDRLSAFENALITRLSGWMSNRRWFMFWLIGFPIWAIVRSLLMGFVDWDTIFTTALWSWWPFAVENIVKVVQGRTLEAIAAIVDQIRTVLGMVADLVVEIKRQNDRSEDRDQGALERDLRSAKRDSVILASIQTQNELLEAIARGGDVDGGKRARTRSKATRRKRAAGAQRKRKSS